mmetsp:Transcript_147560/g.474057  ORF Transcript_147560/g.474057 Transcript_147560/m.474057 type:complete len:429 (+) Transcript_147560:56-1342(+)
MELSRISRASRVFVVGGHTTTFLGKGHPNFIWKKHPDFGKRDNPSLKELIVSAVQGALESPSKAVPASLIDRAYVGNFAGELFNQQGHLGASLVAADPGFMYKPSMRIEGACASGGLAVAAATDALRGGSGDLALVVGAEMMTAVSARDGALFLARAADFARQASIDDFTFPCLLAQRTKHYADRFPNFSFDDLTYIVEKAYANGNKNPKAHMTAVKIDQAKAMLSDKNPNFLSNPEFAPFCRLTDCSQVSDGASAIILANEAGLEKAGIDKSTCVEIVQCEMGIGNLYEDTADLTVMDTAKAVVSRVYQRAGVGIGDINVAEVHDCFSIAELLMYEAIGLAEHGKGGNVAKEGITHLDGRLPVNTGGGLMSFGHPVGATGVKQVHEIYRQMKGQCGDYQMKSIPGMGLTVNMGGDDKTIVATLLRNC